LTLTPESTNIIIPNGGGSFQYDFSLTNTSASTQNVDIWITIDSPGISRTLGPVSRSIAAGGVVARTFTQSIPAGAPAGSYTLTGSAGTFPVATASDSFPFEKSALGPKRGNVRDWSTNLTLSEKASSKASLSGGQLELAQNYPNPFGGSTTLQYVLSERTPVKVAVYDQLGRQVRLLVNSDQASGLHSLVWDGTDDAGSRVSSGVYLYRLETDAQTRVRSMTLLKTP